MVYKMFSQEVTLADMPLVVERFLQDTPHSADRATVVGLSGELGAGKTTFTQALATKLGVSSEVVSPTFVIMKRYPTKHPLFSTLIHIDAYRLENAEELAHLGFETWCNTPKTLIVIEWPERVSAVLPAHTTVEFSVVSGDTRIVRW
jgi:tRNA threonylcarbamoyladenosine biosynthesis protein TsaE